MTDHSHKKAWFLSAKRTEESRKTRAVLRPEEAAEYIGLKVSTLAKRRLRGEPPKFVRLGSRAIGYRVEDLDDWLSSNLRRSTSDVGDFRP